jgi:hypothetical protein
MRIDNRGSLDAELAKAPLDVPPPRDLWPGVVRGIVRTPRAAPSLAAAPWLAYAASIAALCLAAALIWIMVYGRAPVPASGPGTGRVAADVPASFGEPRDPQFLAARADLERTFRQRLSQLDPATRAKIEADLASIRQARDDIRKALAARPDCPVLEQLLASALHDEFDLYEDVVRTTQPTTART